MSEEFFWRTGYQATWISHLPTNYALRPSSKVLQHSQFHSTNHHKGLKTVGWTNQVIRPVMNKMINVWRKPNETDTKALARTIFFSFSDLIDKWRNREFACINLIRHFIVIGSDSQGWLRLICDILHTDTVHLRVLWKL